MEGPDGRVLTWRASVAPQRGFCEVTWAEILADPELAYGAPTNWANRPKSALAKSANAGRAAAYLALGEAMVSRSTACKRVSVSSGSINRDDSERSAAITAQCKHFRSIVESREKARPSGFCCKR